MTKTEVETWKSRADRYLAINAWLKRRYSEKGWLTVSIGGLPTRYSILDIAFFHRYVS